METTYRGVKIEVMQGRHKNELGKFVLSWPGHREEIGSQRKLEQFILTEAKEFVDAWLEDGYIQLADKPNI